MSKRLAHYSPEDVTVIIAGTYQVTGFASGTFVSISKTTPIFSERVSADGVAARRHTGNDLYRISLTLHQSSDSNQALTYMSRIDDLTRMGKFPMIIKDQLGTSLFFGSQCWIENVPDLDFSEDITEREWVIVAHGVMNVGGNDDPSSTTQDIFNIGSGLLSGVV